MSVERSVDQRLFAAAHVAYEVEAMVDAALRFRELEDNQSDDTVARNSFIEAALVHARNLIEFFAAKRSYDDDIRPRDFGIEWDRIRWAHLLDQREPIHKHVSHLTWARLDATSPRPGASLFRDVLEACEAFRAALSSAGVIGEQPIRETLEEIRRLAPGGVVTERRQTALENTTSISHVTITGRSDPLVLRL